MRLNTFPSGAVATSLAFLLLLALVWGASKVSQTRVDSKPSAEGDEAVTERFESERERRVEGALRRDAPDEFARFHRSIRTRSHEEAPTYPPNYRMVELQKAWRLAGIEGSQKRRAPRRPLPWVERGPGNVAGRARAIVVDPADPSLRTWFVGSAGGGVWMTADGGQTWEERTAHLPNLATTTLALPVSNPNTIYAGTGEGFGSFSFVYGQGIWKSIDKGISWTQLASTAGNPAFTNVLRLIVDPNDENRLVAATSTGVRGAEAEISYLMRSTDGGANWSVVYRSASRIEQVIAGPDDFRAQYAAINGNGVLKSTDGGVTWSEHFTDFSDIGRLELAVAPSDPTRVYAAAEGGIFAATLYASADAGENWAPVSESQEQNVDWFQGQGWYDNTLAVDPYDPRTVYAGGVDIVKFEIEDSTLVLGRIREVVEEDPSGLFHLNLALSGPVMAERLNRNSRLSSSEFATVEVRWGPNRKQKAHRFTGKWVSVYADYIEAPFEVWNLDTGQQLMAAYEDDDADSKWDISGVYLGASERIFIIDEPYSGSAPHAPTTEDAFDRAMYILTVLSENPGEEPTGALPQASMRIVAEVGSYRRANLTQVTQGYGIAPQDPRGAHVDHHHFVLAPTDPEREAFLFLDANDGGVAYSVDRGASFTQTGDTFSQIEGGGGTAYKPMRGLNTAQFYGIDKMNGADRYVGGTQDNGSWVSPEGADARSAWTFAPSGDGFEAAWHYANPEWIVQSSQFNNLQRSTDGGRTWRSVSPSGEAPFLTRLAKSNQAPDLLFAVTTRGLVRSTDFGSTWEQIALPGAWEARSQPTVRISLASSEVVWAGAEMSDTRTLQVSTDGGDTFAPTAAYADLGAVTDIATHPNDPQTAYALFSMAASPKILRTTDVGQSWEDISGFQGGVSRRGFPDVAVYSLTVMPHDDRILWAGTEIGLFISEDGGATWAYGDTGLPAAAIWQMRIVNDQVIVATHGRGIWTVTLPELANHSLAMETVPPAIRSISGGADGRLRIETLLPAAYDSARVLADGATIAHLESATPGYRWQVDASLKASAHRTVELRAIGYREGLAYPSIEKGYSIYPLPAAQAEYATGFDGAASDFLLDGFTIGDLGGLPGIALHSPHPYRDFQDLTAQLLVPIRIASANAVLQYDEIVRIEPGKEASVYGDEAFFDHAIVEGSSDRGLTWQELEPGYDSRYVGFQGDMPALLAPPPESERSLHTTPLAGAFAPGEEILIRFRLVSDHAITGWGWAIDNLRIFEALPTDMATQVPYEFALDQNYPNPFRSDTRLTYSLAAASPVELAIYDLNGRLVQTLLSAEIQSAGVHQVDWDGRNQAGMPVASGMYVYRLRAGSRFTRSRMMVVVR